MVTLCLHLLAHITSTADDPVANIARQALGPKHVRALLNLKNKELRDAAQRYLTAKTRAEREEEEREAAEESLRSARRKRQERKKKQEEKQQMIDASGTENVNAAGESAAEKDEGEEKEEIDPNQSSIRTTITIILVAVLLAFVLGIYFMIRSVASFRQIPEMNKVSSKRSGKEKLQ